LEFCQSLEEGPGTLVDWLLALLVKIRLLCIG
jgi:hypothetical protein